MEFSTCSQYWLLLTYSTLPSLQEKRGFCNSANGPLLHLYTVSQGCISTERPPGLGSLYCRMHAKALAHATFLKYRYVAALHLHNSFPGMRLNCCTRLTEWQRRKEAAATWQNVITADEATTRRQSRVSFNHRQRSLLSVHGSISVYV